MGLLWMLGFACSPSSDVDSGLRSVGFAHESNRRTVYLLALPDFAGKAQAACCPHRPDCRHKTMAHTLCRMIKSNKQQSV